MPRISHPHNAVGWNSFKQSYDTILWLSLVSYLIAFTLGTRNAFPQATLEIVLIRATATLSLILLHLVLAIGPLCRLNPRFLPLLYNRRHLGVSLCLIALSHALLVLMTYHSGGDLNPLISLFVSDLGWRLDTIPFQLFGVIALTILLLMAGTSHDFWLKRLSPVVWKRIHMGIYVVYAAVIIHVVTGILRSENHPLYVGLLLIGGVTLATLHWAAARGEGRRQKGEKTAEPSESWIKAFPVETIPPNRARILKIGDEEVAIYHTPKGIVAISNVCRHQNGPLGEGEVINGCITCPWHGFQYQVETGASQSPSHQGVATYDVVGRRGWIWVKSQPNPLGMATQMVSVEETQSASLGEMSFFVGWRDNLASVIRKPLIYGIGIPMLLAISGVTLSALQSSYEPAIFEDGNLTSLAGRLERHPIPHLALVRPSNPAAPHAYSHIPLVNPLKWGVAEGIFEAHEGQYVHLEAALIYKAGWTMAELDPTSITPLEPLVELPPLPELVSGTTLQFKGEIVDSKCFLGAMNPGQFKAHRACAIRCVSGGIPSMAVHRHADGTWDAYYLLDESAKPLGDELLPWIGIQTEISGLTANYGDLSFLLVNPLSFQSVRSQVANEDQNFF